MPKIRTPNLDAALALSPAYWRVAVRQHPTGYWQGCVGCFSAAGVPIITLLTPKYKAGPALKKAQTHAQTKYLNAATGYQFEHLPVTWENCEPVTA